MLNIKQFIKIIFFTTPLLIWTVIWTNYTSHIWTILHHGKGECLPKQSSFFQ